MQSRDFLNSSPSANSFFDIFNRPEADDPPRGRPLTPIEIGQRGNGIDGHAFSEPKPIQAASPSTEADGADDLGNSVDVQPASYTEGEDYVRSPAAMFLSSFSPMANTVVPLEPDAEGAVVGGYTLSGVIGYGGFSTIRKAFSRSGSLVAIKIVRRDDVQKQHNPAQARRQLSREAETWATLSHEHVLPLFSVERSASADFFITAFCPAGSLFDILKRDGRPALPQDDAGVMFRQVVRGLRYLHETARLVHRDMKLENVLVDEMGVCRISDFGSARRIGEPLQPEEDEASEPGRPNLPSAVKPGMFHRTSSLAYPTAKQVPLHLSLKRHQGPRQHRNSTASGGRSMGHFFADGSLPYAAPELLLPPPSGTPLLADPSQDIWAVGVMLYAMLAGRLPFTDQFEPRLQMKIIHGTYQLPLGIGSRAERVLQGCLERSVEARWTVETLDEDAWGVGWGDNESEEQTIGRDVDERQRGYETEHIRRRTPSRDGSRRSSLGRHRTPSPRPAHASACIPEEQEVYYAPTFHDSPTSATFKRQLRDRTTPRDRSMSPTPVRERGRKGEVAPRVSALSRSRPREFDDVPSADQNSVSPVCTRNASQSRSVSRPRGSRDLGHTLARDYSTSCSPPSGPTMSSSISSALSGLTRSSSISSGSLPRSHSRGRWTGREQVIEEGYARDSPYDGRWSTHIEAAGAGDPFVEEPMPDVAEDAHAEFPRRGRRKASPYAPYRRASNGSLDSEGLQGRRGSSAKRDGSLVGGRREGSSSATRRREG
ncbi:kinase-like domain-containing protein [Schizophyllum amplum]|uniref:Kinase-like domain-containing protein n=1 Tax=Schizophyllum amplum TaxID=97359 RepID=A0A550CBE8_9AGAR|nr:kinase-like domain-containing protein [Auriculariopsis ampla]